MFIYSISFYSFLDDCRHNKDVEATCGDGNKCLGSYDDWICVCDKMGWEHDANNKSICLKSKLFVFSLICFNSEVRKLFQITKKVRHNVRRAGTRRMQHQD